MLAGSDMVLYKAPPLPIHQELGYMVDYGITPVEAVRTATYNAASVLGIEKETGSLKEGLAGDLLVVKEMSQRIFVRWMMCWKCIWQEKWCIRCKRYEKAVFFRSAGVFVS